MKYWEICKAIDEGSPSVYVHESGCTPSFIIEKQFMDGWTEVKQSVTWQEALEAWSVGKKIRCVINKGEYIFKDGHRREFKDQEDFGLAVEHITKGTWYIEN